MGYERERELFYDPFQDLYDQPTNPEILAWRKQDLADLNAGINRCSWLTIAEQIAEAERTMSALEKAISEGIITQVDAKRRKMREAEEREYAAYQDFEDGLERLAGRIERGENFD